MDHHQHRNLLILALGKEEDVVAHGKIVRDFRSAISQVPVYERLPRLPERSSRRSASEPSWAAPADRRVRDRCGTRLNIPHPAPNAVPTVTPGRTPPVRAPTPAQSPDPAGARP